MSQFTEFLDEKDWLLGRYAILFRRGERMVGGPIIAIDCIKDPVAPLLQISLGWKAHLNASETRRWVLGKYISRALITITTNHTNPLKGNHGHFLFSPSPDEFLVILGPNEQFFPEPIRDAQLAPA